MVYNLYDLLDIAPDAPAKTLEKRFEQLKRRYRYDVTNKTSRGLFQIISSAYSTLRDQDKKELYDRIFGVEIQYKKKELPDYKRELKTIDRILIINSGDLKEAKRSLKIPLIPIVGSALMYLANNYSVDPNLVDPNSLDTSSPTTTLLSLALVTTSIVLDFYFRSSYVRLKERKNKFEKNKNSVNRHIDRLS